MWGLKSKMMKQATVPTQKFGFNQLFLGLVAFAALANFSRSAQASETMGVPIIGGSEVSASAAIAKRTVGLFFLATDKTTGLCTGSILDTSHILTAAHCVENFKQGLVIFSNSDVIGTVKQAITQGLAKTPNVRVMSSAVAQPGYPGHQTTLVEFNDLAIITFSGGLPAGYEPAKFLTADASLKALKKNVAITLAGYGITSAPSNKPVAGDADQGSGTLRQVKVRFSELSAKKIDIFVEGATNHIACSGDSGGPAMVSARGEYYVIGIASRSDCHVSSIYTLVNQGNVSQAQALALNSF